MTNEITAQIDRQVAEIREVHGYFCWHQNNRLKEFLMDLKRNNDGADWFDMVDYVYDAHGVIID